MHFGTKNYLKSTRNHTAKQAPSELIKKDYDGFRLEPSFKYAVSWDVDAFWKDDNNFNW
jgi:hypothetical protein